MRSGTNCPTSLPLALILTLAAVPCLAAPLPKPQFQLEWSGAVAGGGAFGEPGALAVGFNGEVYVAHDSLSPHVVRFNEDGAFRDTIPLGTFGGYTLSADAIAIAPDSAVWAMGANIVERWKNSQKELFFSYDNGGSLPGGPLLAMAGSPNYLFLAATDILGPIDTYSNGVGIARMDSTGHILQRFHTKWHAHECPGDITAMAADVNDNVYIIAEYTISDSCLSSATRHTDLRKYSSTGDTLRSWPLPTGAWRYTGLAVDRAGAIYYCHTGGGVDVIAADTLESNFEYVGGGPTDSLRNPQALAISPHCELYVSDDHNRVVRLGLDADGDGICDSWERDGIVMRDSGSRWNPPDCHISSPDIYVEADCVDSVAFDTVQVRPALENVFSAHGAYLHVKVDELGLPIVSWPDSSWWRYQAFKKAHFGTPGDSSELLEAKGLVYRYCACVDTVVRGLKNVGGFARGGDMVLSLGKVRRKTPSRVIPWQSQSGVFLHELGHSLGLDHGGVDGVMFKPNYVSVMNYEWTEPTALSNAFWTLRYSSHELPTLHEVHLVDSVGIGADVPKVPIGLTLVVHAGGGSSYDYTWVKGSGRADWDQLDDPPTHYTEFCDSCDVNHLAEDMPLSVTDTFVGANDWDHIKYAWRDTAGVRSGPDGTATGDPVELDDSTRVKLVSGIADCNGNAVDDDTDIANRTSLDADHDFIPDECEAPRVHGFRDTVTTCPGGDADTLVWTMDIAHVYVSGSGDTDFVKVDSLGTGVAVWSDDGQRLAVGDRLAEYDRDYDDETFDLTAHFRITRASGCGPAVFSIYSGDSLVARGLRTYIRSFDQDAAGIGSVDRRDTTYWHSNASCDTCFACGDFTSNGHTQAADLDSLRAHLGHHIPRQFIWPSGTIAYSLGDTVRISWRRGLGDSAYVRIRAIRGTSTDTTLIVAATADTGAYVWTVPSTQRAAGDYKIQVVHIVGRDSVNYEDLGIASSDTIGIRPIPVADAATTRGKHSWTLSWDEPTQNGGIDADQYDVRYSAGPYISNANFLSMTVEPPDAPPGAGGTAHCVESDSAMITAHTYYFAIKTRVGSVWSLMSPVDSARTGGPNQEVFCSFGDLMAGGGGGEDESRQSGPIASERNLTGVASVNSEMPVVAENSLLGWAGGEYASDTYKLPVEAVLGDAGYAVRLRQLGKRPAEVDNVGLGYVDHAAGIESYVASSAILLGESSPASAAWESNAGQTGQFASATVDSPFMGIRGSALIVPLSGSGQGRALVIAATGPSTQAVEDTAGILVEVPAANSSWQTVGLVHPRRALDEFAVALPSGSQARLVYYGNYAICGLKQLAVQSQVVPSALTLTGATHSRLGDVKNAESAEGGGTTTLELGDTLNLSFATAASSGEMTRELFLTTRGRFGVASLPDTIQQTSAAIAVAPVWQFSLGNARPNPSVRDFTIDYTLARSTAVNIRVYDVAGRLVRTLVNESLAAGPHSIVWDGRNQDGRRVASSVYFYRMVAGSFTSQRKAVLLTR